MSAKPHLHHRNGHFYYRIKVPLDLRHSFQSSEIKKSLKTSDPSAAKEEAIILEYKVSRTFRLIRSGLLSDHQIACIVSDLLPKRQGKKRLGIKLSAVMEAYAKEHEKKWGPKTKLENLGSYKLILDVIGDIEIRSFSKQTTVDLRDKLGKLPANMYKIYPGKTVKQILSMPDIEPMSTTSVNKHMFRLSTVLKYAVKEGHLQVNYAEKMKIHIKRRADEERKAYDICDLQKVVASLPRLADKPERFWIPLIAMHTGLRLDEICQLYVEDLKQVEGVWCISVNDEHDKKVKTLSGRRMVPVHPVLLLLGMIDHVQRMRNAGVPRLWMNLKWRKADGYSNAFGKWFQRFNREHVGNDPQKTFHSFRHTVANTLKQAGMHEVVIAEIMGHANDSMTMSRYGKRYQPKVLLDALSHLDYELQIQPWR